MFFGNWRPLNMHTVYRRCFLTGVSMYSNNDYCEFVSVWYFECVNS